MTDQPGAPMPIYGFLQPGERTERAFSCPLDDEHVAILQRTPGQDIRIAEQTDRSIVLENTGEGMAPYLVHFPTQAFVRAALGAKELVGYLAGLRGKK